MIDLKNETGGDFNSAIRVLKLTKPYLSEIFIICVLMLVGSSVNMLLPQMVGVVIDLSSKNGRQVEELTHIALILIVLFLLSSLLNFATSYWLGKIGAKFSRYLRASLYQKIIYMPPAFFNENKVGDLMSRLTASLSTIQRVVVMQIPKGGQAIVRLIVSLTLLFFLHFKMTLIALIVVPFIVAIGFFYGKKFKAISDREQNVIASSSAHAEETLNGVRTIQSYCKEEYQLEKYQCELEKVFDVQLSFAHSMAIFSSVTQFIIYISLVSIFWYGGYQLLTDQMTAGELTAYVIYCLVLTSSVVELGLHYASFKELEGAAQRVFKILDTSNDRSNNNKIFDTQDGSIEIKTLSFSYDEGGNTELNDINIIVPEGKTTAFVGASGSGKSTLFNVIMGFYKPKTGSVLIGNQNIEDIGEINWRKRFSYVSQDTYLFGGTIRENLAFVKPDASEDEIMNACKFSGAHSFIMELQEGYDTYIGPKGSKLSGGQKQRLSIARAYLYDSEILLLDEATSSLDSDSEMQFLQRLVEFRKDKTNLIIAHRIVTVKSADNIYVMDKGAVSDSGTHSELIYRSDIYKRYWDWQSKHINV